ncbi:hypothetical protein GCM10011385_18610 [Nitratireductor aestuarii]|uniref:YscD cytoplasmic domain-containing protein n=1 Tax=Nitratireductor aestuarii TaxID=1735103 RepID=A0A916RQQ6_9HYPH|nr:FHA domain-containing protein [Nitratireductor aestuarii]GGA65076.1 hypothetical protein GCM10011385_18610 [Nitratireductor aestuarii]
MSKHDIDSVILKILSGVQAGVDVSLVDGTYILGSADDADIQILDVSLSPHHAKLTVDHARASLQALAGPIQLRSGPTLSPHGKAHELRPLDVVTMGMTRFAVAPMAADWAYLGTTDTPPTQRRRLLYQPMNLRALWDEQRTALLGAAAGLLFLGFWVIPHSLTFLSTLGGNLAPAQEKALSKAIRSLEFANHLTIRKARDGTLHLDGAVNTLNERQATLTAVNQTGIPVVTHILVLDTLRDELAAAISKQAPDAVFSMASDGAVVIGGTMPEKQSVTDLLQLVKNTVGDSVPIRSSLKTYDDILGEVIALGRKAQLSRTLHFKLNGTLIEAEGSVPPAQLDSWAGFLQSYAQQFAPILPFRSLVRQQKPDGTVDDTVPLEPFYIGIDNPADGQEIDLDLLSAGRYTAADLLIGGGPAASEPEELQSVQQVTRPVQPARPTETQASLTELLNAGTDRTTSHTDLDLLARRAIELAQSGKLAGLHGGTALKDATERLQQPKGSSSLSDYGKLLREKRRKPQRPCWSGSNVAFDNVTGALFWLDVLSQSQPLTTTAFDRDTGEILAEAALNPMKVAQCAHLASDGTLRSYYLERVSKEPHLARVLLRNVAQAPVQISGISLPGNRYFQTTNNQIFHEGSLLNPSSSVMSIGELGVLFSTGSGLSVAFPGSNLTWETN